MYIYHDYQGVYTFKIQQQYIFVSVTHNTTISKYYGNAIVDIRGITYIEFFVSVSLFGPQSWHRCCYLASFHRHGPT